MIAHRRRIPQVDNQGPHRLDPLRVRVVRGRVRSSIIRVIHFHVVLVTGRLGRVKSDLWYSPRHVEFVVALLSMNRVQAIILDHFK